MTAPASQESVADRRAPVQRVATGVARVLGHDVTPWVVALLFAAQAALVAFTFTESVYDESYHLAIIEYFSHRALPFLGNQQTPDGIGDISRYGSYLYHYVMSFPWRFTTGLPLETRIVILRLLTVAMVAGSLLVLRRLALELQLSRAVATVVMIIAAAPPLLTFVAASVNYDGALVLALAFAMLYAVRLARSDRVDGRLWALFLVWSSVAALTKYVALPLLLGVGVGVVIRQGRVLRATRGTLGRPVFAPRALRWWVPALVGIALLIERYGVNLVRFHAPQPDCSQVHSVVSCLAWSPWDRNYFLDIGSPDQPFSIGSLFDFGVHTWIPLLMKSFTLTGVLVDGQAVSSTGPHIGGVIVVYGAAVATALITLAVAAVLRPRGALLLVAGVGAYLAALLLTNFADLRHLGQPVGVQGRYLLPVFGVLVILGARAVAELVTVNGRYTNHVRLGLLVVLAVLLTQGAGILGVVARTDDTWLRTTRATPLVERLVVLSHWLQVPDRVVDDPRS